MQFNQREKLIYLISRDFLPGLFLIFWPTVPLSSSNFSVKNCQLFLEILENALLRSSLKYAAVFIKYTLDKIHYFSKINKLLENYQNVFISHGDLKLSHPIHFGQLHKEMEWFKPDLDQIEASNALLSSKQKGAFIVRKSSDYTESDKQFTLLFLGDEEVHKLKVPMFKDHSVLIGPYKFSSLVEGIHYFHYKPLYRNLW